MGVGGKVGNFSVVAIVVLESLILVGPSLCWVLYAARIETDPWKLPSGFRGLDWTRVTQEALSYLRLLAWHIGTNRIAVT